MTYTVTFALNYCTVVVPVQTDETDEQIIVKGAEEIAAVDGLDVEPAISVEVEAA